MSAGGGLAAAGRPHPDASSEMKTGPLDILLCYGLEMLTLGDLEKQTLD